MAPYDKAAQPMQMSGNVFIRGAKSSTHEQNPLVQSQYDPGIKLLASKDKAYLNITLDKSWVQKQSHKLVTTKLLGRAKVPDLPYVQPDDSPYRMDTDWFDKSRNTTNPFPGPFERPEGGRQALTVWPIVAVP